MGILTWKTKKSLYRAVTHVERHPALGWYTLLGIIGIGILVVIAAAVKGFHDMLGFSWLRSIAAVVCMIVLLYGECTRHRGIIHDF